MTRKTYNNAETNTTRVNKPRQDTDAIKVRFKSVGSVFRNGGIFCNSCPSPRILSLLESGYRALYHM